MSLLIIHNNRSDCLSLSTRKLIAAISICETTVRLLNSINSNIKALNNKNYENIAIK